MGGGTFGWGGGGLQILADGGGTPDQYGGGGNPILSSMGGGTLTTPQIRPNKD